MPPGHRHYTLRNHGADLTVRLWWDGRNQAVLMVDGVEVDRGSAGPVGRLDLAAGSPHHVRVAWWWRGRPATCAVVETPPMADPADENPLSRTRPQLTPLAPPLGTRARRAYGLQARHPRLWASRHVAVKVAGIAAAILGINAILRALLPRLDVRLPGIDVDVPGWVRYLDVGHYLPPVVDWLKESWAWLVPDWLPETGWVKYAIGLLIAINVARAEVKRRSERARREADAREREGAGD